MRPLHCGDVPALTADGVLIAGACIEQHQRPDHRRVGEVESERHVAAEREPTDDGIFDPEVLEDGGHVIDGRGFGVGRRFVRRI